MRKDAKISERPLFIQDVWIEGWLLGMASV